MRSTPHHHAAAFVCAASMLATLTVASVSSPADAVALVEHQRQQTTTAQLTEISGGSSHVVAGESSAEVADQLSQLLFKAAPAHIRFDPDLPHQSMSMAAAAHLPLVTTGAENQPKFGTPVLPKTDTVPSGIGLNHLTPLAAGSAAPIPTEPTAAIRDGWLLADHPALPINLQLPPTRRPPADPSRRQVSQPHQQTSDVVLLVADNDPTLTAVHTLAVAAGDATVLTYTGTHPADDPHTIRQLQALSDDQPIVAVDSQQQLDADSWPQLLPVLRTGVQLPAGGQRILTGPADAGGCKLYVGLYGHPDTASLGVLGEQPISQTLQRARQQAAKFEPHTDCAVIPMFEIIATVATASAGPDGDYSSEPNLEQLQQWVAAAADNNIYVLLDLQPGRTNFLTQTKQLQPLLEQPHVGVALDPEWRLECPPRCQHLKQIGQVGPDEVNRTLDWINQFTADRQLPQKLVVLHQFRTTMLRNRTNINIHQPHVQVVVQMDGQGTQPVKNTTWNILTNYGPDGLQFGWKNFHDEDHPTLTPKATLDKTPTPVLVTYQ